MISSKQATIFAFFAAVITVLLITAACGVGIRKEPGGFLGDYSQFKPDPEYDGMLTYEKPGTDWSRFTKLEIDPVLVFIKPGAKDRELDPEAQKMMADYFRNAVVKAVEDLCPVVDRPGSDVLRIRAAITEVIPANVALNVLSGAALMIPVDMGGAAMEAEFLDSMTGERLGAVVHKRVGTPLDMVGGYTKWGHAKAAFDYWAQELRKSLEAPEE
jgi:hypothetical protein